MSVFIDVNGIHGLDFSAMISGDVAGEKAFSPFSITVANNGTLSRAVTSAGLGITIKQNGVTLPSSQYVVTAKSATLAAHKSTKFVLKWNHGTSALHAGDTIMVKACVNLLGDETPANNCGTKNDPQGDIAVFAWPKATGNLVKASSTTTTLGVWLTNISSFKVRPIRVAENVSASVSVNGGPAQPATVVAKNAFALDANGTTGVSFKWNHGHLTVGDTVVITSCAHITGNTPVPNCYSRTVIASK